MIRSTKKYLSSSKYNSYLFYSTCTKNSHMIFRYRYSFDECGLLNMHLTKCIDDCSIGVLTNILPLLVVYLPVFWFHNVCYYYSGCNDICHFRIYSSLNNGLIFYSTIWSFDFVFDNSTDSFESLWLNYKIMRYK